MSVGFFYDDVFLKHETPQWHPECRERLVSIVDTLRKSPQWDKLRHIRPRKATFEEIEMTHTREYVDKIRHARPGYLDPDTYFSAGTLEASLHAAGAVLDALERCRAGELRRAFCAVRPPGHHAEADRAMGFCIFNNVAVGARYAQSLGWKRVFIIDFDVHHGNGTQHIFQDDDTVFYFSTHQFPHYPGTGAEHEHGTGKGKGTTYNVPMASGSGNKEYFTVYHDVLPHQVQKFGPDVILVSAGYDIHTNDPLSGVRVSADGIRSIVNSIVSLGLPLIFSLEGGYDLKALGESVLITIEEMLKG